MKVQQFLTSLENEVDKTLVFEIAGERIPAKFHITEIKNLKIDSVDCGGQQHQWQETVFQLWTSDQENNKDDSKNTRPEITVGKALSIIDKVKSIQSLEADSDLKFEYLRNTDITLSQYDIAEIETHANELVVKMGSIGTQCKPMQKFASENVAAKNVSCGASGPKSDANSTRACC